jgi:guanylate kinase
LNQLKQRIVGRGSETAESIAKRLQTAENEMKKASVYDHMTISGCHNDDFVVLLEIYQKVQRWYIVFC